MSLRAVRSMPASTGWPPAEGNGVVVPNASVFIGGFDDRLRLTPEGWRIAARSGSMALEHRPG